jgi:hypothetical protein
VSEEARARVQALPWVSSLVETGSNGARAWQVSVDDEAAAESLLLRTVLSDPAVTVAEFGRQKYDLEEVFLNIVEGGNNGK